MIKNFLDTTKIGGHKNLGCSSRTLLSGCYIRFLGYSFSSDACTVQVNSFHSDLSHVYLIVYLIMSSQRVLVSGFTEVKQSFKNCCKPQLCNLNLGLRITSIKNTWFHKKNQKVHYLLHRQKLFIILTTSFLSNGGSTARCSTMTTQAQPPPRHDRQLKKSKPNLFMSAVVSHLAKNTSLFSHMSEKR